MPAQNPASIVNSAATVSEKIRALAKAGHSRADIARLLGKRYQHVRNVLEDEANKLRSRRSLSEGNQRGSDPHVPPTGVSEDPSAFAGPESKAASEHIERVQLDAEGRLLLTRDLIEALDAQPGEWVIATVGEDRAVTLLSARAAMKRAQAIIRRFVPAGTSLVEELLAERRAEAERENNGE